ncbi:MAG TPA: DUF2993 domain-containing protein [Mycobacteriales bacterium]|nr:DUF2993 domain-containing protein [Mycobacteriales bacterium]
MRRAIIVVVIIVGLLVVADRVAVVAADRIVAERIQTDQGLQERPDVSIGGFPFLTQAIGGRYGSVTLTVHDLHRVAVAVHTLTVHLSGVHVPLSAVFRGHVSSVPVDHATASIVLTYADLNAFFGGRHLTVSKGDDGEVRVAASASVAGHTLAASGQGRVDVRGTDLVVTIGNGLDLTIPLGGLPFRIALVSAKATNTGVVVSATAAGLVLHPR